MKVICNKYQKTLGFTRCNFCGSALCIQKTDATWGRDANGKTVSFFTCAACGHKQKFKRKDLTSRKKVLEDLNHKPERSPKNVRT